VIADANENTEVVPMAERVEEAFGQRPEAVLADGLNATGPNIVELEQRGIEFLSPASAEEKTEGNPAVRDEPRQPVPEDAWPKHVLGLRQFLLQGLEKVRTEWLWACTGYNLR